MDIFAQKKFLVRIIILLSLLNLFSISIFIWKDFFHKPPQVNQFYDNRDVSDVLKNELNLTKKQTKQIRNLRSDFFEKEKILAKTIRTERDSMNREMFNKTTDDELVKLLARRVADNEFQMEILRFEQAKAFKSICTHNQLEKFEKLILEIRDYFKPDNQPKR